MALKSISTRDLQTELARRERGARVLLSRRNALQEQLSQVEAELSSLGHSAPRSEARGSQRHATVPGEPRRRARNRLSLADAIAEAMQVRAVISPAAAAKLVRSNGYESTSKNFGMMVANALAKDERFKRLSRGQYERIG